ncbi:MAG: M48 family metalloprotease [Pseudobacteriovorax sp.]|nr:M48 family metalloprotease [Pseudobacteriovorax sp.]
MKANTEWYMIALLLWQGIFFNQFVFGRSKAIIKPITLELCEAKDSAENKSDISHKILMRITSAIIKSNRHAINRKTIKGDLCLELIDSRLHQALSFLETGTIQVSRSILEETENPADIAFVIAHEIAHFVIDRHHKSPKILTDTRYKNMMAKKQKLHAELLTLSLLPHHSVQIFLDNYHPLANSLNAVKRHELAKDLERAINQEGKQALLSLHKLLDEDVVTDILVSIEKQPGMESLRQLLEARKLSFDEKKRIQSEIQAISREIAKYTKIRSGDAYVSFNGPEVLADRIALQFLKRAGFSLESIPSFIIAISNRNSFEKLDCASIKFTNPSNRTDRGFESHPHFCWRSQMVTQWISEHT